MTESEFDRFAEHYEEMHRKNIAFSGCDLGYFAKYKVDVAAEHVRQSCADGEIVLDFGCGLGASVPHFAEALPAARLLGMDVSHTSLAEARARYGHLAEFRPVEGHSLDLAEGSVGFAFSACVFHHIPAEEHGPWFRELHRVVRPGGKLMVFEHNPLNPLTRHAVNTCVFDADAVLVRAGVLADRVADAGWQVERVRYHIFFPQVLSAMRRFEPALGRIPFGGQYSILCRKS